MKKIIAVALALILALSFCTVIAFAEDAAAPAASGSIDYAAILQQVIAILQKIDYQKLMTTMMALFQQLMGVITSVAGK